MREATGELNMTVVVVLAVAGLVAFFSMVIFPMFTNSTTRQQNCSNAVCEKPETSATCTGKGKYVDCHDPKKSEIYCCPYKG